MVSRPRSFTGRLVLLLALVVIATSLLAPFVSRALAVIFGTAHRFSFPRVYDRVLEILAVAGFLVTRRWLGLTSWTALGLGDRARRRDLWLGLGIALVGMAVLLMAMYWADALRLTWRYPLAKGVRKAVAGTVAAGLIGTAEELLFRGILLGGLMRDGRRGSAVVWTTAVYAVVHFLRGGRQTGVVTLTSGFERLAGAFAPLAGPDVLPALVGFLILGFLLAYGRLWSGGLCLPIGLHTAYILTLRVGRVTMDFPRKAGILWGLRRPPLVSGVAGWIALLATLGIVYWRWGPADRAAGRGDDLSGCGHPPR